ncbi:hypothetical protein O9992_18885 [Vibrio lentus]|nr:hypothetical protein [Vibrio lentus]
MAYSDLQIGILTFAEDSQTLTAPYEMMKALHGNKALSSSAAIEIRVSSPATRGKISLK